jgi:DNA-binding MarR family transcriptional regulator
MASMHQRIFDIYDYIEDYNKHWGQMPTQKEIAIGVDCDPSSVSYNLNKMEKLGMIQRPERKMRAIILVTRQPNWDALVVEQNHQW